MRKKSQLQMGENVVILVIFFFLLVIAVIFFANIQKSKFSVKQKEFETRSILDFKTLISTLPELACTENQDITEACIDIINLEFMQRLWEQIKDDPENQMRDYYFYRFGDADIKIRSIDPKNKIWTNTWTLYSYGDSNFYRIVRIPISLYNATSNDYLFGVIELKVFT